MLEETSLAAVELFVTRFAEQGADGWRDGALDVGSVSTLPRVRAALSEHGVDHVDEDALFDAIEAAVERAISDLRRPNNQAALELVGLTKKSGGKGRVERDDLAAKELGRGGRWLRGPSRRYENLKPRDWLIRQVAKSLMTSGKPMIAVEVDPDSSTVPASAVARLRLSELTPAAQKDFYDKFLKQAPRFDVPRYLASPGPVQEELQQNLPVDTKPLQSLLEICGIKHPLTDPPMTNASYDKLRGRDAKWAPVVRRAFEGDRTERHVEALQSLYDYLSCQNNARSIAQTRRLDVVVVAGARRAMNYRLDELLNTLYQVSPTVILAGLAPLDHTSAVPISEADAMLYYVQEERDFDTSQLELVLDHRATDTTEALQHALGPIREKAHRLGRPVHVGLVTGPYHMRRMYFIAKHRWSLFAHAIASISPLPSGSSIDLRVLLDRSEASLERRDYGFRVFIQEYIKLIGGRVVAEF